MGQLSEQLKNWLETATPEEIERVKFKVDCKCNGIDPTDNNAHRKLKNIKIKTIISKVISYLILIQLLLMVGLFFFAAGATVEYGIPFWSWTVITCIGFGYLWIFILYKILTYDNRN